MKFFLVLILILISVTHYKAQQEGINEYAVEMDMDDLEANLDLSAYNIEVVRKVSALGNVYHLKHEHACKSLRCKREASETVLNILLKHPMIHRVEEQVDLEVEKKEDKLEYFYDDHDLNIETQKKILEELDNDINKDLDAYTELEKKPIFQNIVNKKQKNSEKKTKQKIFKKENEDRRGRELDENDEEYKKLVEDRQHRLGGYTFNDPEVKSLWQYHNYGQFDVNPGLDMNLFNVYKANITGRGVVVTVIDDGIDTRNEEIQKNFDPAASLDLNDPRNKASDPRGPAYRDKMPEQDGHGTLCGGTIAGEANNGICAFGVSFNANLGGIRMLSENMVTDLLEAYALTHNNQYIDIYSNSWGPKDTGTKTSPVTYYVKKAMQIGTSKGRRGKGSLYLFAAGNGGINNDHCGADGFVNSPYTISVTAVNIYGRKPSYTEECSAISITAAVGGYSNDLSGTKHIIDPRLTASQVNNKCKNGFVGTSAATPLVAGCIALSLEANNNLSWRDINHLFSVSARIPNSQEIVWQMNTVGILSSHVYGFGLLDCTAMVRNAQMWNSVGPLRLCVAGDSNSTTILKLRSKKRTRLTFQTSACERTANAIDRLEHVLVHTKIQHPCRGDLAISLTSPTNTRSFLLKNRVNDKNSDTISFSFLSLMNWGENPRGKWYLDILDIGECGNAKKSIETGKILDVVLEFHGTSETDSAQYKNEELIKLYHEKIKITPPERSIILSDEQTNEYYNNQRKYFIQLNTLDKEVIELEKKFKTIKSQKDIDSYKKQLNQRKNTIPEDELKFLNNLLHNSKA